MIYDHLYSGYFSVTTSRNSIILFGSSSKEECAYDPPRFFHRIIALWITIKYDIEPFVFWLFLSNHQPEFNETKWEASLELRRCAYYHHYLSISIKYDIGPFVSGLFLSNYLLLHIVNYSTIPVSSLYFGDNPLLVPPISCFGFVLNK